MSIIEQKGRDVSRPLLEAIGRILSRWNVSPDWVTLLGLVLTIGVGVLAATGEFLWAGLVYIFAAVCDAIDGTLARVSGKGSRFGAFLDSTIDRFEESIVLLGLSIYYAQVGGQWEIPLILVVAVGSLMVSYTRARAEAIGVSCKVGFMTRPPRVFITIAGLLLNQVFIALIVLAVTSLVTALHRVYHVWRLTGGEDAGWAPAKEPFEIPGPLEPIDEAPSEPVEEEVAEAQ
jgi:CDP-diacylglycerol--glycerol-3-phosphate 3-phosphatidyltransferase